MSLRADIEMCIREKSNPAEAAKLICGYLHGINLANQGGAWFSDDPEMEIKLEEAYAEWLAINSFILVPRERIEFIN
jgi:hypothetical protein